MDFRTAARSTGTMLAGGDTVERTAAFTLTATAGTSFGPGLLPRPGLDQALATGIVAATQHGLVMTSQSAAAALARRFARDDGTPAGRARSFAAQTAVGVSAAAAGAALGRLVPARPGEPVRRAALRTAGRRAVRIGLVSAALSAVAAADAAVGGRRPGLRILAAGGGLLAGTAFAGWQIHRYHAGEEAEAARLAPATDPVTGAAAGGKAAPGPPPLPPVARSVLLGAAVTTGLHGLALAEGAFARGLAAGLRRSVPAAGAVAGLAGHATALGVTLAGLGSAVEYLNRRAETGGSAIDAAYTRPDSATVSGGSASGLPWESLSREGVRFVNLALSRREIADVTGAPIGQVKAPVRAFAGLASGPTVDVRVDLVMEELARLGAFGRSVLCVASPTGTGYVNYVAIETLEYLTRGDCATVALQYSLRPSVLSMDRVGMGREQNRALLHALEWRLRGLPEDTRPRLVGFGESLGAHTLQDAFLHEGVSGLHRVGMGRALFLGTPAGSKWARQWRLDPEHTDPAGEVAEVASYQEWLARPADDRARSRYVLLSHHEDPITRFEPALAVQQPGWLGPAALRPPGVSRLASWYPITTFVLTLVDVKNATDVTPGTFAARGHDYRADLARMVSEAYALPAGDEELLAIEHALRRREAAWAERRVVAEQLHRAREAVQRQTGSWGMAQDAVS